MRKEQKRFKRIRINNSDKQKGLILTWWQHVQNQSNLLRINELKKYIICVKYAFSIQQSNED